MVVDIRIEDDREEKTSFIIIDSQSIKNTDTAEETGYDGGKKIKGIKRHIAVDTQGLPHAIAVTTADVGDRDGAITMIEDNKANLTKVQNILADGGYTGDNFAQAVKDILGEAVSVEIGKKSNLVNGEVTPKRWVVERCFAWLEKCRRLWKNCERKLNTSLQMVNLAFLCLLLKRL